MNKKLLVTGSILGILGIAMGAFAAHGLRELIDPDALKSFETGVRYQMYHALLLVVLGSASIVGNKTKGLMFYMILFGVIFFSGSIYGLATNKLFSFDFKSIALITPIGGVLLILAWVVMLIGIIRNKVD